MQQLTCKMLWSFSFILFKKALLLKTSPGGNGVKMCGEV